MADLNTLLLFAGVVQAGSFSAASRRLGLPVSTVSRRVAGLEEQLGVRLIERSTRSLRLTPVGAAIFEQARRGAEVSDAVDTLASDQAAGLLRLSAPSALVEPLLVPVATAFQASYPDVRVHILSARPGCGEAEGADLLFWFGVPDERRLVAARVLRYRHRLVASPGYILRHGAPKRPGDLLGHRLLSAPDWTPDVRWEFVRADGRGEEGFGFRPHLAVGDAAGLVAAVLADGGICDLPPLLRSDLLRNGRLVEVMPDWRFQASDLHLLQAGGRYVSRPARLFGQMAAAMASGLFPDLPG